MSKFLPTVNKNDNIVATLTPPLPSHEQQQQQPFIIPQVDVECISCGTYTKEIPFLGDINNNNNYNVIKLTQDVISTVINNELSSSHRKAHYTPVGTSFCVRANRKPLLFVGTAIPKSVLKSVLFSNKDSYVNILVTSGLVSKLYYLCSRIAKAAVEKRLLGDINDDFNNNSSTLPPVRLLVPFTYCASLIAVLNKLKIPFMSNNLGISHLSEAVTAMMNVSVNSNSIKPAPFCPSLILLSLLKDNNPQDFEKFCSLVKSFDLKLKAFDNNNSSKVSNYFCNINNDNSVIKQSCLVMLIPLTPLSPMYIPNESFYLITSRSITPSTNASDGATNLTNTNIKGSNSAMDDHRGDGEQLLHNFVLMRTNNNSSNQFTGVLDKAHVPILSMLYVYDGYDITKGGPAHGNYPSSLLLIEKPLTIQEYIRHETERVKQEQSDGLLLPPSSVSAALNCHPFQDSSASLVSPVAYYLHSALVPFSKFSSDYYGSKGDLSAATEGKLAEGVGENKPGVIHVDDYNVLISRCTCVVVGEAWVGLTPTQVQDSIHAAGGCDGVFLRGANDTSNNTNYSDGADDVNALLNNRQQYVHVMGQLGQYLQPKRILASSPPSLSSKLSKGKMGVSLDKSNLNKFDKKIHEWIMKEVSEGRADRITKLSQNSQLFENDENNLDLFSENDEDVDTTREERIEPKPSSSTSSLTSNSTTTSTATTTVSTNNNFSAVNKATLSELTAPDVRRRKLKISPVVTTFYFAHYTPLYAPQYPDKGIYFISFFNGDEFTVPASALAAVPRSSHSSSLDNKEVRWFITRYKFRPHAVLASSEGESNSSSSSSLPSLPLTPAGTQLLDKAQRLDPVTALSVALNGHILGNINSPPQGMDGNGSTTTDHLGNNSANGGGNSTGCCYLRPSTTANPYWGESYKDNGGEGGIGKSVGAIAERVDTGGQLDTSNVQPYPTTAPGLLQMMLSMGINTPSVTQMCSILTPSQQQQYLAHLRQVQKQEWRGMANQPLPYLTSYNGVSTPSAPGSVFTHDRSTISGFNSEDKGKGKSDERDFPVSTCLSPSGLTDYLESLSVSNRKAAKNRNLVQSPREGTDTLGVASNGGATNQDPLSSHQRQLHIELKQSLAAIRNPPFGNLKAISATTPAVGDITGESVVNDGSSINLTYNNIPIVITNEDRGRIEASSSSYSSASGSCSSGSCSSGASGSSSVSSVESFVIPARVDSISNIANRFYKGSYAAAVKMLYHERLKAIEEDAVKREELGAKGVKRRERDQDREGSSALGGVGPQPQQSQLAYHRVPHQGQKNDRGGSRDPTLSGAVVRSGTNLGKGSAATTRLFTPEDSFRFSSASTSSSSGSSSSSSSSSSSGGDDTTSVSSSRVALSEISKVSSDRLYGLLVAARQLDKERRKKQDEMREIKPYYSSSSSAAVSACSAPHLSPFLLSASNKTGDKLDDWASRDYHPGRHRHRQYHSSALLLADAGTSTDRVPVTIDSCVGTITHDGSGSSSSSGGGGVDEEKRRKRRQKSRDEGEVDGAKRTNPSGYNRRIPLEHHQLASNSTGVMLPSSSSSFSLITAPEIQGRDDIAKGTAEGNGKFRGHFALVSTAVGSDLPIQRGSIRERDRHFRTHRRIDENDRRRLPPPSLVDVGVNTSFPQIRPPSTGVVAAGEEGQEDLLQMALIACGKSDAVNAGGGGKVDPTRAYKETGVVRMRDAAVGEDDPVPGSSRRDMAVGEDGDGGTGGGGRFNSAIYNHRAVTTFDVGVSTVTDIHKGFDGLYDGGIKWEESQPLDHFSYISLISSRGGDDDDHRGHLTETMVELANTCVNTDITIQNETDNVGLMIDLLSSFATTDTPLLLGSKANGKQGPFDLTTGDSGVNTTPGGQVWHHISNPGQYLNREFEGQDSSRRPPPVVHDHFSDKAGLVGPDGIGNGIVSLRKQSFPSENESGDSPSEGLAKQQQQQQQQQQLQLLRQSLIDRQQGLREQILQQLLGITINGENGTSQVIKAEGQVQEYGKGFSTSQGDNPPIWARKMTIVKETDVNNISDFFQFPNQLVSRERSEEENRVGEQSRSIVSTEVFPVPKGEEYPPDKRGTEKPSSSSASSSSSFTIDNMVKLVDKYISDDMIPDSLEKRRRRHQQYLAAAVAGGEGSHSTFRSYSSSPRSHDRHGNGTNKGNKDGDLSKDLTGNSTARSHHIPPASSSPYSVVNKALKGDGNNSLMMAECEETRMIFDMLSTGGGGKGVKKVVKGDGKGPMCTPSPKKTRQQLAEMVKQMRFEKKAGQDNSSQFLSSGEVVDKEEDKEEFIEAVSALLSGIPTTPSHSLTPSSSSTTAHKGTGGGTRDVYGQALPVDYIKQRQIQLQLELQLQQEVEQGREFSRQLLMSQHPQRQQQLQIEGEVACQQQPPLVPETLRREEDNQQFLKVGGYRGQVSNMTGIESKGKVAAKEKEVMVVKQLLNQFGQDDEAQKGHQQRQHQQQQQKTSAISISTAPSTVPSAHSLSSSSYSSSSSSSFSVPIVKSDMEKNVCVGDDDKTEGRAGRRFSNVPFYTSQSDSRLNSIMNSGENNIKDGVNNSAGEKDFDKDDKVNDNRKTSSVLVPSIINGVITYQKVSESEQKIDNKASSRRDSNASDTTTVSTTDNNITVTSVNSAESVKTTDEMVNSINRYLKGKNAHHGGKDNNKEGSVDKQSSRKSISMVESEFSNNNKRTSSTLLLSYSTSQRPSSRNSLNNNSIVYMDHYGEGYVDDSKDKSVGLGSVLKGLVPTPLSPAETVPKEGMLAEGQKWNTRSEHIPVRQGSQSEQTPSEQLPPKQQQQLQQQQLLIDFGNSSADSGEIPPDSRELERPTAAEMVCGINKYLRSDDRGSLLAEASIEARRRRHLQMYEYQIKRMGTVAVGGEDKSIAFRGNGTNQADNEARDIIDMLENGGGNNTVEEGGGGGTKGGEKLKASTSGNVAAEEVPKEIPPPSKVLDSSQVERRSNNANKDFEAKTSTVKPETYDNVFDVSPALVVYSENADTINIVESENKDIAASPPPKREQKINKRIQEEQRLEQEETTVTDLSEDLIQEGKRDVMLYEDIPINRALEEEEEFTAVAAEFTVELPSEIATEFVRKGIESVKSSSLLSEVFKTESENGVKNQNKNVLGDHNSNIEHKCNQSKAESNGSRSDSKKSSYNSTTSSEKLSRKKMEQEAERRRSSSSNINDGGFISENAVVSADIDRNNSSRNASLGNKGGCLRHRHFGSATKAKRTANAQGDGPQDSVQNTSVTGTGINEGNVNQYVITPNRGPQISPFEMLNSINKYLSGNKKAKSKGKENRSQQSNTEINITISPRQNKRKKKKFNDSGFSSDDCNLRSKVGRSTSISLSLSPSPSAVAIGRDNKSNTNITVMSSGAVEGSDSKGITEVISGSGEGSRAVQLLDRGNPIEFGFKKNNGSTGEIRIEIEDLSMHDGNELLPIEDKVGDGCIKPTQTDERAEAVKGYYGDNNKPTQFDDKRELKRTISEEDKPLTGRKEAKGSYVSNETFVAANTLPLPLSNLPTFTSASFPSTSSFNKQISLGPSVINATSVFSSTGESGSRNAGSILPVSASDSINIFGNTVGSVLGDVVNIKGESCSFIDQSPPSHQMQRRESSIPHVIGRTNNHDGTEFGGVSLSPQSKFLLKIQLALDGSYWIKMAQKKIKGGKGKKGKMDKKKIKSINRTIGSVGKSSLFNYLVEDNLSHSPYSTNTSISASRELLSEIIDKNNDENRKPGDGLPLIKLAPSRRKTSKDDNRQNVASRDDEAEDYTNKEYLNHLRRKAETLRINYIKREVPALHKLGNKLYRNKYRYYFYSTSPNDTSSASPLDKLLASEEDEDEEEEEKRQRGGGEWYLTPRNVFNDKKIRDNFRNKTLSSGLISPAFSPSKPLNGTTLTNNTYSVFVTNGNENNTASVTQSASYPYLSHSYSNPSSSLTTSTVLSNRIIVSPSSNSPSTFDGKTDSKDGNRSVPAITKSLPLSVNDNNNAEGSANRVGNCLYGNLVYNTPSNSDKSGSKSASVDITRGGKNVNNPPSLYPSSSSATVSTSSSYYQSSPTPSYQRFNNNVDNTYASLRTPKVIENYNNTVNRIKWLNKVNGFDDKFNLNGHFNGRDRDQMNQLHMAYSQMVKSGTVNCFEDLPRRYDELLSSESVLPVNESLEDVLLALTTLASPGLYNNDSLVRSGGNENSNKRIEEIEGNIAVVKNIIRNIHFVNDNIFNLHEIKVFEDYDKAYCDYVIGKKSATFDAYDSIIINKDITNGDNHHDDDKKGKNGHGKENNDAKILRETSSLSNENQQLIDIRNEINKDGNDDKDNNEEVKEKGEKNDEKYDQRSEYQSDSSGIDRGAVKKCNSVNVGSNNNIDCKRDRGEDKQRNGVQMKRTDINTKKFAKSNKTSVEREGEGEHSPSPCINGIEKTPVITASFNLTSLLNAERDGEEEKEANVNGAKNEAIRAKEEHGAVGISLKDINVDYDGNINNIINDNGINADDKNDELNVNSPSLSSSPLPKVPFLQRISFNVGDIINVDNTEGSNDKVNSNINNKGANTGTNPNAPLFMNSASAITSVTCESSVETINDENTDEKKRDEKNASNRNDQLASNNGNDKNNRVTAGNNVRSTSFNSFCNYSSSSPQSSQQRLFIPFKMLNNSIESARGDCDGVKNNKNQSIINDFSDNKCSRSNSKIGEKSISNLNNSNSNNNKILKTSTSNTPKKTSLSTSALPVRMSINKKSNNDYNNRRDSNSGKRNSSTPSQDNANRGSNKRENHNEKGMTTSNYRNINGKNTSPFENRDEKKSSSINRTSSNNSINKGNTSIKSNDINGNDNINGKVSSSNNQQVKQVFLIKYDDPKYPLQTVYIRNDNNNNNINNANNKSNIWNKFIADVCKTLKIAYVGDIFSYKALTTPVTNLDYVSDHDRLIVCTKGGKPYNSIDAACRIMR